MDRGRLWRTAFGNNVRLLELNGAGLTPELAARRPAEGVASAAWILGHLVSSRRGILRMVGGTPTEDAAWEQHYARGGAGASAHLPWDELVAAFQSVGQALQETILAVEDWDRPTRNPVAGKDQPLEQVLSLLFMHECYHLGQLGLIRKLLRLPGVI